MVPEIHILPVLTDNYIFLFEYDGKVVVIDPAVANPVIEWCETNQKAIHTIWNTHHHHDHVGANLELKNKYQCEIYGFKGDSHRIPGITKELSENEVFDWQGVSIETHFIPGHTLGHICYHIPQWELVFIGDTVFSAGCGRLFEGTPTQMWSSLVKIMKFPKKTKIYCTHEYTQSNIEFAKTVESNNHDLLRYEKMVDDLRSKNIATIPTTLEQELLINPFLRCHLPEFKKNSGFDKDAEPSKVFSEIRSRKDHF